MMVVTKRGLPRRTLLRGLGAALALPLLDSMVPALSALRATPARGVRRMAVLYVPNGMMMPSFLRSSRRWRPTATTSSS